MCLMPYANNKSADQPAHPRSPISASVVRCLDSIISLDSIAEISTPASFCGCASRFVSGLVGNSQRHVLSCRGSYQIKIKTLGSHYELMKKLHKISSIRSKLKCYSDLKA